MLEYILGNGWHFAGACIVIYLVGMVGEAWLIIIFRKR